jgi:phosphate transport system substrate-binding protein
MTHRRKTPEMEKFHGLVRRFLALMVGVSALALFGCGGSGGSDSAGAEVRLTGAGATFPNPLYQKWFSDYNKTHPSTKFDYQSLGSGAGIKQITEKTIDFAGSDPPMNDEQIKAAPAEIVHVPTCLGAVVLTYNLPTVTGPVLKFSGEAVAGIFLGEIKKWNDAALAKDNPGVSLPATDISVVHRSDGSGTTYVFTDYLSKVSPAWKDKVGTGTSPNWPAGTGSKGNEGVTGSVKQTPNSIGYVELIYAEQNKLPYADVKNADAKFVKPSLESVTKAAAGAASQVPADLRVSITNAPGPDAYPISSFTYFLVYKEQPDKAKGKALVDFMWWATHDGQVEGPALLYASLPGEIVRKDEEKIKSITFQGQPLYTGGK